MRPHILSYVEVGQDLVVVSTVCMVCRDVHEVQVPRQGFLDWRNGAMIQNAMPEVSKEQREMLISGTCPGCFAELFPPED